MRSDSQPLSMRASCCFGCRLSYIEVVSVPVVYENAPVVLVALEVRHPTADPLTPTETREIRKRLGDIVPIERPGQHLTIQVLQEGNATAEAYPRFVNRQRTLSVSIRKEGLVVEASDYPGWEKFHALVANALQARQDVAPVLGVDRVGLRYINEIRVPGGSGQDWADWVSHSLLAPSTPDADSLPTNQWQCAAVYGAQPGYMLVFRYGAREGFAVDPNSDLRRAIATDGGPFFLMDIDSFWTPDGAVPEYERDMLMATCETLHRPVRTLFDSMISERLRREVLKPNA